MINFKQIALGIATIAVILLNGNKANAQSVTWKLNNLDVIGSLKPELLGKPVVKNDSGHKAIAFNGINDGMLITNVPIEGWKQFTIEILFKPDGDGPIAPRIIHFVDGDGNRCTFEIRLNKNKEWFLDTFLKNGKAGDKGTTLIDSTLTHPANRWYWVGMVFDGKNMLSFVNGAKEKEAPSNFPVLGAAKIAIGVRLNRVNWFKGQISEIRFSPIALNLNALQRVRE